MSLRKSLLKTKQPLGLEAVSEDAGLSLSDLAARELDNLKIGSVPGGPPPRVRTAIPESSTTGLTWQNYDSFKKQFFSVSETYSNSTEEFQTYYKSPPTPTSPILICLHGAGSSSMTFAKFAEYVSADVGVFVFDLRGHGHSSETDNFSMDSFVRDLHFVFETFTTKHDCKQHPLYFVGHSLGGAIMAQFLSQYKPQVQGIILLDIVEEMAIKSLSVMPQFIAKRPAYFAHIDEAISWHMNFLLHDEDSARLSIPDLFKVGDTLTWKLDLTKTEKYWDTWFANLSKNFLKLPQSKLLILSTHETLDKELIIGQMQGKYQLIVFNNNRNCGHFIQEDLPKQIGISVLDFIKRNEGVLDEVQVIPKWGGKIHT